MLAALHLFNSCECLKVSTRQGINPKGEVVGQTSTAFIQGVSEGIDKTLQCTVSFSDVLKQQGLSNGKIMITSD